MIEDIPLNIIQGKGKYRATTGRRRKEEDDGDENHEEKLGIRSFDFSLISYFI